MTKQTSRVLADRIANATWEQHRETINRLFILQNRKLEGPEGVIQVMSKVHGFRATKPQYEARLRSWNIRKKITDREWIVILLHVHARAQHGKKTLVIFNGALLNEERVAREINRRLSRYNSHLNNLQDLPKVPLGFRLQSPSSAAVPYADNPISGHNPTGCVDLYLKPAIVTVADDWFICGQDSQLSLSLFTLTSSDTTWRHRIAPERYGKQQRNILEKQFDKSLNFHPSCMDDIANENVADELGNMGPGHHSIRWCLSTYSSQLSSFKDRYDNGFLWGYNGTVNLHHKSWHCDDCSNRQTPSPFHDQCEQCRSTNGTLLEQKFQRRVQFKLIIPGAMLHVEKITSEKENANFFSYAGQGYMDF